MVVLYREMKLAAAAWLFQILKVNRTIKMPCFQFTMLFLTLLLEVQPQR